MTVVTLILAALSLLLAAAHLLRHFGPLALLVLVGLTLIGIRRPIARRLLQLMLVLAGVEWVRTLVVLAQQRMAAGQPWLRMAVILGAVSVVTVLAAVLLVTRGARRYFDRPGAV